MIEGNGSTGHGIGSSSLAGSSAPLGSWMSTSSVSFKECGLPRTSHDCDPGKGYAFSPKPDPYARINQELREQNTSVNYGKSPINLYGNSSSVQRSRAIDYASLHKDDGPTEFYRQKGIISSAYSVPRSSIAESAKGMKPYSLH